MSELLSVLFQGPRQLGWVLRWDVDLGKWSALISEIKGIN